MTSKVFLDPTGASRIWKGDAYISSGKRKVAFVLRADLEESPQAIGVTVAIEKAIGDCRNVVLADEIRGASKMTNSFAKVKLWGNIRKAWIF